MNRTTLPTRRAVFLCVHAIVAVAAVAALATGVAQASEPQRHPAAGALLSLSADATGDIASLLEWDYEGAVAESFTQAPDDGGWLVRGAASSQLTRPLVLPDIPPEAVS